MKQKGREERRKKGGKGSKGRERIREGKEMVFIFGQHIEKEGESTQEETKLLSLLPERINIF